MNRNYSIIILLLFVGCIQSQNSHIKTDTPKQLATPLAIVVDTFSISSPNRLEMTRKYALENYGMDDYRLLNPSMIVIHYTAIATLDKTLNYFKSDSLDSSRKKIIKKSPLNVGVHYVVDKDGTIYSLLPDSIMGRHLIGFNHIALGIENVSKDSSDLTLMQLESNVKLVKYLSDKYPSIKYLIGHYEYDKTTLAHYKLLVTKDSLYMPYKKHDPGMEFMNDLRNKLNLKYELVFEK